MATWSIANKRNSKICALCMFWFDPTYSALKPDMGDFYKYDPTARKKCSKQGQIETLSWHSCNDFVCKV